MSTTVHDTPVSGPSAVAALAATELRLILRHRLTAYTALAMPLVLGVVLALSPATLGPDRTPAVHVVVVLVLALYCGATTSLTARRQDGYLKRLRSGEIGDAAILAGLLVPMAVLGVGQALLMAAVTVVFGVAWPGVAGAGLAVVGTVLAAAFLGAAAAATSGLTGSPETAQFTTLPLFVVVGGASFAVAAAAGRAPAWLLALPGAGPAELIRQGWSPGPGLLVAFGSTLAWTLVALLVARSRFRWETRG